MPARSGALRLPEVHWGFDARSFGFFRFGDYVLRKATCNLPFFYRNDLRDDQKVKLVYKSGLVIMTG